MTYSKVANQSQYPFVLSELPYSKGSLVPHLSMETFDYHYDKHHSAYVTNLNNLTKDTNFANMDLETIITTTYGKSEHKSIFNNAAQVWNHTFYWHSMKKHGGGSPKGDLLSAIEADFGGLEAFFDAFKKAANHFASAWIWLIKDENGKLHIRSTGNADLPITSKEKPLITCDIWEHAYYIDFRNRRLDYVEIFLKHLINWDFAEENFTS